MSPRFKKRSIPRRDACASTASRAQMLPWISERMPYRISPPFFLVIDVPVAPQNVCPGPRLLFVSCALPSLKGCRSEHHASGFDMLKLQRRYPYWSLQNSCIYQCVGRDHTSDFEYLF